MNSLLSSAVSVEQRAPELIIMHAATGVMYMEDIKEKVMKTERRQTCDMAGGVKIQWFCRLLFY